MKISKRFHLFVIALFIMIPVFVACGTISATTANCAFVVGNGMNGNDSTVHKVVYPGQTVTRGDREAVWYVPCNSRNYIINDGTQKNANNETVGDRFQLITATTRTGVPIKISARALWTLNQSDSAMRAFYTVCFKYQCAISQDQSGDVNFSTKGWNGMLSENFGPTMDAVARIAAIEVDDSIWKQHNPAQYKALSDKMSENFADVMRLNLGYPEDLFCGSGNSAWKDPANPGQQGNEFTCTPVRIAVDDVQRGQVQADESSEGAAAINEQRLKNAKALYGENAGYWLALQDSIDKCATAKTTCIINIGGSSGVPAVAIPVNTPTPEVAATPTAGR
jgi:hypothetical protein